MNTLSYCLMVGWLMSNPAMKYDDSQLTLQPGLKYGYANRFVYAYYGSRIGFGGTYYRCYMLEDGEIVIDYNYGSTHEEKPSFRGLMTIYSIGGPPAKLFMEYRSGLLISGKLDGREQVFIPELSSKVMRFDHYKEGMPPIYNLPGFFSKTGNTKSSDSNFDRLTKTYRRTPQHEQLLRTTLEPLPANYYHKLLKDKHGEHVCFGTIMHNGNFNYDLKPGIIRDTQAIKTLKLPPNLYGPKPGEEYVYEFRTERLILGKLTGSAFVPAEGSEVVSYGAYQNGKVKLHRIYNLPESYK